MASAASEMSAIEEKVELLERQRAQLLQQLQESDQQARLQRVMDAADWAGPEAKRRRMPNEEVCTSHCCTWMPSIICPRLQILQLGHTFDRPSQSKTEVAELL